MSKKKARFIILGVAIVLMVVNWGYPYWQQKIYSKLDGRLISIWNFGYAPFWDPPCDTCFINIETSVSQSILIIIVSAVMLILLNLVFFQSIMTFSRKKITSFFSWAASRKRLIIMWIGIALLVVTWCYPRFIIEYERNNITRTFSGHAVFWKAAKQNLLSKREVREGFTIIVGRIDIENCVIQSIIIVLIFAGLLVTIRDKK